MHKWFVKALVGALGAAVISAPLALAATPPPTAGNAGSGQGLEISPPVIQLDANPGQTVTTVIRVRNVTSGVLIAKGKVDDFGAGTDESGTPKLLLDESGATRFSLKYWVSGVPDLTLASQELKTATVSINVPRNAEPGGHFGVVRFTGVPPDLNTTGVALSASVGTLILLRVSGAITDKADLAQFSTGVPATGKTPFSKKSFFEHGPVAFLVRIKNEGTVHEKVKGSIELRDTFGKKVTSVVVNASGGNVLPDSTRRFEEVYANKQLFGHYTAKLALTYAGNKTITGTTGFWVIPWKLILLVLLGLVIVLWVLKIGMRRYNEHIIAQARRRR
jgi:hypothetical protein